MGRGRARKEGAWKGQGASEGYGTNQLKSNGDVSVLAQDERFLTAAVMSVSAPEIS